jgi:hypothetical protein
MSHARIQMLYPSAVVQGQGSIVCESRVLGLRFVWLDTEHQYAAKRKYVGLWE